MSVLTLIQKYELIVMMFCSEVRCHGYRIHVGVCGQHIVLSCTGHAQPVDHQSKWLNRNHLIILLCQSVAGNYCRYDMTQLS